MSNPSGVQLTGFNRANPLTSADWVYMSQGGVETKASPAQFLDYIAASGASGFMLTSGAPANTVGLNGQLAFDVGAGVVYGPKAGGVWPGSSAPIIAGGLSQNVDATKINYTDPIAPAFLKTISDLNNAEPVSVMRFIDTSEHSAIYDQSTAYDATVNLQDAFTAVGNNGSLEFPRGKFIHQNLTLANKTGVKISGNGTNLQIQGDGSALGGWGWQLGGAIDGLDVTGFVVVGQSDQNYLNNHKFIWSLSDPSLSLQGVRIYRNEISNVANGISLNANLSGSVLACLVAENYIHDIYGIYSGYGYGIHVAYLAAGSTKNQIIHNWIARAKRHAIYCARASDILIQGNAVWDHRSTLTGPEIADANDGRTKIRPAFNIARSHHVQFIGNYWANGYDGGVLVTANPDQEANTTCYDVLIESNHFNQPANAVPPLIIGDMQPNIAGFPEDVLVQGNKLFADFSVSGATTIDLMRHYAGKNVRFRGNHVTAKNIQATSACMEFRTSAETAGTNTYSDNLVVEGNDFHITIGAGVTGANARGIRVDTTVCTGGAYVEIGKNSTTGSSVAEAFEAALITNPNYRRRDQNGGALGVYVAGATTIDVSRGVTSLTIANTVATSITAITGGVNGQRLRLHFADANTTIVNSSAIRLAGGANVSGGIFATLSLIYDTSVSGSSGWSEDSLDSGTVLFAPSWTGSKPRSSLSKMADIISVEDYYNPATDFDSVNNVADYSHALARIDTDTDIAAGTAIYFRSDKPYDMRPVTLTKAVKYVALGNPTSHAGVGGSNNAIFRPIIASAYLLMFSNSVGETAQQAGFGLENIGFSGHNAAEAAMPFTDACLVLQGLSAPRIINPVFFHITGRALRLQCVFEPVFTNLTMVSINCAGTAGQPATALEAILFDSVLAGNVQNNVNNVTFDGNPHFELITGTYMRAKSDSNIDIVRITNAKFEASGALASSPNSPWPMIDLQAGVRVYLINPSITNFNIGTTGFSPLFNLAGSAQLDVIFPRYAGLDALTYIMTQSGSCIFRHIGPTCLQSPSGASNQIGLYSNTSNRCQDYEFIRGLDSSFGLVQGKALLKTQSIGMISSHLVAGNTNSFIADSESAGPYGTVNHLSASGVFGYIPNIFADYPFGVRIVLRVRSTAGTGTVSIKANSSYTQINQTVPAGSTYGTLTFDIPSSALSGTVDSGSILEILNTNVGSTGDTVFFDGFWISGLQNQPNTLKASQYGGLSASILSGSSVSFAIPATVNTNRRAIYQIQASIPNAGGWAEVVSTGAALEAKGTPGSLFTVNNADPGSTTATGKFSVYLVGNILTIANYWAATGVSTTVHVFPIAQGISSEGQAE